jgi:hypothetical protein
MLGVEPQLAAGPRGKSRADVNRRTFAAKRHAAAERDGAAEEFSQDRAKVNDAVLKQQRHACLRDAAASRFGKEAVYQHTGDKGADERSKEPLECIGVHQELAQLLGDIKERDDDQADQSTDDQRQQQQDLFLMLLQVNLGEVLSNRREQPRQTGTAKEHLSPFSHGVDRWSKPDMCGIAQLVEAIIAG